MSDRKPNPPASSLAEAASQLQQAAAAKKCWPCGCFHDASKAIDAAFPKANRPQELDQALRIGASRITERRYDCLGCEICFPALAINALQQSQEGLDLNLAPCPTADSKPREGWPPLPGDYVVLRYEAPVAICTLNDPNFAHALAGEKPPGVSIVGSLQTENLGIERLISNVVANPHIRFLILCGPDSKQTVGHFAGQSLLALWDSGLDEKGRITRAKGKRPVIKNLPHSIVNHFRETIEVVDRRDSIETEVLKTLAQKLAARTPGTAPPLEGGPTVRPIPGHLPQRIVPDPAGYFVVYVNPACQILSLEHFQNEGVLTAVIEGKEAAELYTAAIERGLVSRLDHAAYLGRELARAQVALREGKIYVQDGAPEANPLPAPSGDCGCESTCK